MVGEDGLIRVIEHFARSFPDRARRSPTCCASAGLQKLNFVLTAVNGRINEPSHRAGVGGCALEHAGAGLHALASRLWEITASRCRGTAGSA